ncbi:MAG: hypothetical protein Q4C72_05990 [Eubacteriales bacterium]|nr:hypothetical protein [Eubacteriales bacterium]
MVGLLNAAGTYLILLPFVSLGACIAMRIGTKRGRIAWGAALLLLYAAGRAVLAAAPWAGVALVPAGWACLCLLLGAALVWTVRRHRRRERE